MRGETRESRKKQKNRRLCESVFRRSCVVICSNLNLCLNVFIGKLTNSVCGLDDEVVDESTSHTSVCSSTVTGCSVARKPHVGGCHMQKIFIIVNLYIHINIYICCICVFGSAYAYICTYICVHTCIYNIYVYISLHIHIYVY